MIPVLVFTVACITMGIVKKIDEQKNGVEIYRAEDPMRISHDFTYWKLSKQEKSKDAEKK